MARFAEGQIEEVKAKVDLIDLISSYGIQVSRTGAIAKCKCPFHNEKTPSFSIDGNKGLYYCFGCGEAGDAIKFVEKQEGVDFPTALRQLAQRCGVTLEEKKDAKSLARGRLYALMAELAQFYSRCLDVAKEAELARNYVAARNLNPQTVQDYLIGYAPRSVNTVFKWAQKYGYSVAELEQAGIIKPSTNGGTPYYYFGGRLVFPVKDKSGRVVAFSGRQLVEDKKSGKYVNSPETAIFKKGKTLYGFDKASSRIVKSPTREVIICEGQIDCIRLQTMGYGNAVASQGTAFTEDHALMLKRVADNAVLCFDDDSAGHKATNKTAEILLEKNIPVRVVSLPDGSDPDSFLQTKGADAFRRLIDDKSESIVAFQVRTERAKEQNPSSIDAITRVSNTVMGTIAKCGSPVLRANLMKEASSLLDIDRADIAAEVSVLVSEHGKETMKTADEISDDLKENLAAKAIEVVMADESVLSDSEVPLIQYLIANPSDEMLRKTVGIVLPPYVFKSRLCRELVGAWLAPDAPGEDHFARCVESLSENDYREFLSITTSRPLGDLSDIPPAQAIFFYARQIWMDHLVVMFQMLCGERGDEVMHKEEYLAKAIANLPKLGRRSFVEFIRKFDQKSFDALLKHASEKPQNAA